MDILMEITKVLTALFLGGLLGFERTIAGKTAGIRTYGLVAMSSCLLIVVSIAVNAEHVGITNFDPMRLAAGIITGIGFIGAGLIIFRGTEINGLTTAAGLWVATAIGIAVGFGMFAIALFVTLATLFSFTVLWHFEKGLKKRFESKNNYFKEESVEE
jgi:putative Mg2+ transporter-C (MgtC) family protein